MKRLIFFAAFPILLLPRVAEAGAKPLIRVTAVTPGTHAHATLTVLAGPLDLATVSITDFEGDPFPLSSSAKQLATGATVSLAWDGAAGAIPVTGHALPWTDDELAVLVDGKVADALVWTNGDGSRADAEGKDVAALVAAHQWSGDAQSAAVKVESGMTMTRKSPTTDTDSAADWSTEDVGGSTPDPSTAPPSDDGLPDSGPADIALLGSGGYILLRLLRSLLKDHLE